MLKRKGRHDTQHSLTMIVIIFFICMFILKYMIGGNSENIQYVMLTTGEKYKYVSMIKSLLNNQGVKDDDIHVFIDGTEYLHINDVHQYNIPKAGIGKNEKLTHNYKYMFDTIFFKYKHAVFLEDDIFPSVDAVPYFEWGRRVMKSDHTVFAISGSNDNSIDRLHGKKNNIFTRAEQFLGLGWMTSDVIYKTHLSSHIESCQPHLAWDQCTSKALSDSDTVTIFPMVQRTLHVPYTKGTHSELAGLSFNTDMNVVYPKHYLLTNDYYIEYITKYVLPVSNVVQMETRYDRRWKQKLKIESDVPWSISHLAQKPFGYNKDIVVFPGKHRPKVFIYNDKVYNLRNKI